MLQTIKQGSTGAEVSALRMFLGMKSAVTFDADTVAKVMTFQRTNGLTPDGIVGKNTWGALAKAAKTIRQGDNNNYVSAYQHLNGKLDADGKFGAKTKAAVITFQSAAKLGTDGVVGQNTWGALITGTSSAAAASPSQTPNTGAFGQPKDYKQAGSPWGPKMYSSRNDAKQTYANSACGPTAMADIVCSMKDKTVTPETLGKLAVANGYRTANSGTAWGFFKFIADRYRFRKFAQTLSRATLQAALADGALAVCSMAPGYWTKGGHFICVWQDDGTYIHANDPASSTRKKQIGTQFMKECKQIFLFWP